jgi:hypothetical protein
MAGIALSIALAAAGSAETSAREPAALLVEPGRVELTGASPSRQLLITRRGEDGRERDATRDASFEASPPGVVSVGPDGFVRAIKSGEATILARSGGRSTSVRVTVRDVGQEHPVHFANDVVPILTRLGCNAGGCHGKASGQNGFKLSLFGFDPAFDYETIVREGRGRRVFPAAPDQSLLLLKPSGGVPHGGGRILDPAGEPYQILRRWLVQGVAPGDPKAPTLKAIEVRPAHRVLGHAANQQLAVLARYSDGSVRDVTRTAQYQSNEPGVAAVDGDGLVRTSDAAGEAAVMARYQGMVGAFRATVPLTSEGSAAFDFRAANYVDELAAAKWRDLGLVPSPRCSDGEFLRRVRIDLNGKLPTVDEVRRFLADSSPDKRARLVDRCLDDEDYAAYFALRWGSILRNSTQADAEAAAWAFNDWLREMIGRNRPYDELVRGVVAAAGEWQDAPAINWYWQMRDDPLHQPTADTAQVFLGLRIQCARCHHHPYERWSQDDYYGLAGFFTRVGRKSFGQPPPVFASRSPTVGDVHPRTGRPIEPKVLDGPAIAAKPGDDPRHALVDWMAKPNNPFFAKALCNRMWGHLMGRGLVEPVDDMRETNPPSNPALLDALARDFVAHRFDVKHVLRTICNSQTYQLSSTPNTSNARDRQNHARAYGKRLIAEVLLDAVDGVCGTTTAFGRVPKRARAVDLPHEGFGSYFLDVFDRPQRTSSCECARSSGASLQQVLHLANSSEIEDKVAADDGRIARLIAAKVAPQAAVDELYLATFARSPTALERARAVGHLTACPDQRRGLEDLLWALLNSREFQFNH